MKDFLSLTKTLSDKSRLNIVISLTNGELCICQLRKILDITPSKLCQHLFILESAGFIKSREKDGWKYYRLHDDLDRPCADIIGWLKKYIPTDDTMGIDIDMINEVLNQHSEEDCKEDSEEKKEYKLR